MTEDLEDAVSEQDEIQKIIERHAGHAAGLAYFEFASFAREIRRLQLLVGSEKHQLEQRIHALQMELSTWEDKYWDVYAKLEAIGSLCDAWTMKAKRKR